MARKRGNSSRSNLREEILKLLGARALDKTELATALHIPLEERQSLRKLLQTMELEGLVARVRKDRYVLPKTADLFTGVIQFHQSGAAHVVNEQPGGKDLYISGENTHTAMHGDRVVARIELPSPVEGSWKRKHAPARQEGRVIRILNRAHDTMVGTLQRSKKFFYVVADDPRFVHNLYVPEPEAPLSARPGDKVVAKLEAWESRHVNPEGRVIEVLGASNAPGVDMLSIVRKHHLPEKFPEPVLREAEEIRPEVAEQEARRREDRRKNFVFTIDPDDARDFDDAIEVEETSRGWKFTVHIADVSHYVRPRSALDREAHSCGNSVYLADRVIPMLPEALSNGICSLKPDEDRLVFSVDVEITRAGKVLQPRFFKGVIRSRHRLTYKQAFGILSSPAGSDPLARKLHLAWSLASLLRRKRFEAGSLDLDFPEVKVWLDKEGTPVRLEKVENDISHQLIEEFMLLANELVARELKRNRQPSVYRVHEKPEEDRLLEFRETALSFGAKAGDLTNRAELQKLLASLRGKP